MKKILFILISTVVLSSLNAQTISNFGQSSREALPPSYIKMLIWNIHGGTDEDFINEFAVLGANKHLALLQEANLNQELKDLLVEVDLGYQHAGSYISPLSGVHKGVATGSVATATTTRALRSPVNEFGVTTPKAVLLQTFKVDNRDKKLLIVNVHAINFVSNDMFRAHITQIERAMAAHTGPVIAAGDFNTWNKDRLNILDRAMGRLGLSRLHFGEGRSGLPNLGTWFGSEVGGAFDQVYTKGVKIRYKEIHSWATTSDHKPIEVHFSIL